MKTEQVREEIAAENERKRLLATEGATDLMDTAMLSSTLRDDHDDLLSLKSENKQLQALLDDTVADLEKIQDERLRDKQASEQELAQLSEEVADKQASIDNMLENNVSLRFEMSTYRRLLDAEEKHLNRVEQGQHGPASAASALAFPNVSSGSAAASTPSTSGLGISALAFPKASPASYQTSPSLGRTSGSVNLEAKKMTVQKTARGNSIVPST